MTAAQSTIEQIHDFLGRFEQLEQTWASIRTREFRTGFGRIATALQGMQGLRDEIERTTAPRHNIFRTLGIDLHEDKTHTPILADLFDPHGTHGQGPLFLRELLRQCEGKPGFTPPEGDIASARWIVETQRVTAHGTLDIVIACPRLRYLLVIENKVYATEQDDQLLRYSRWLDGQRQFYDTRVIAFLTPHGRKATSAGGREYVRLSYDKDITSLLGRALSRLQATPVRATVRQYLAVTRDL